jgi:hypothetical protein
MKQLYEVAVNYRDSSYIVRRHETLYVASKARRPLATMSGRIQKLLAKTVAGNGGRLSNLTIERVEYKGTIDIEW